MHGSALRNSWSESEKGSYLTKDRKIQFRCVLTDISRCRGFPKMSQCFTAGQAAELCCHHHHQDCGDSLKPKLPVHLRLQGASGGGCICMSECERAASKRWWPWGLCLNGGVQ